MKKILGYVFDALICLALGSYFWFSGNPLLGVYIGGGVWLFIVVAYYIPFQEGE